MNVTCLSDLLFSLPRPQEPAPSSLFPWETKCSPPILGPSWAVFASNPAPPCTLIPSSVTGLPAHLPLPRHKKAKPFPHPAPFIEPFPLNRGPIPHHLPPSVGSVSPEPQPAPGAGKAWARARREAQIP